MCQHFPTKFWQSPTPRGTLHHDPSSRNLGSTISLYEPYLGLKIGPKLEDQFLKLNSLCPFILSLWTNMIAPFYNFFGLGP